jgi:hypothetical protein
LQNRQKKRRIAKQTEASQAKYEQSRRKVKQRRIAEQRRSGKNRYTCIVGYSIIYLHSGR